MCDFDRQYNQLMGLVNDYLYNLLVQMERYPVIIYDSIEYSLFAGANDYGQLFYYLLIAYWKEI